MSQRGYVHVYTGNGKGKTTAALGLAVRAAGHGFRTYFAQFMKKQHYGELGAVREHLSGLIKMEQFGLEEFHSSGTEVKKEEREAAQEGLAAVDSAMRGGRYQVIVMDEINVTLHFGILDPEPVLNLIRTRPENIELILTGRYAPPEIMAVADLITEMREVRHYFTSGVPARDGVER